MAPIKIRQSSTAQTITTSSQDARVLVRETLRISASLASSPTNSVIPSETPPPSTTIPTVPILESNNLRLGFVEEELIDANLRLICCEEIDGRRWKHLAVSDSSGSYRRFKKGSIRSVCLQTPQDPIEGLTSFIRSYVVPEGFPDSVSPSYVPYMTWRALKHFFGGAMGVFTTQTLLTSVGVSRNRATPGAVAINWILKDGAGRVGKMLFARQGKKFDYDLKQVDQLPFSSFDYDLKQLRFAGDLLMELGAGVELATAAVPHLFLPLACAANVAKNVAAVTSTSTRTPIYKAFAKGENIGDVTAKGECVGNVADLLGTGLSIMMSKKNPSLMTTFAFLSCGYVLSSYQEVKSVVLHTLNRARFTVAVESFLKTGKVPSLQEGNLKEKVFNFPWLEDRPIQLGSRFKEAFQDPGLYIALESLFEREKYLVTYNPVKNKVYALLKDQAKSDDILKAAFHGHVLLHSIRASLKKQTTARKHYEHDSLNSVPLPVDVEGLVADSCNMVSATYGLFKYKAAEQGWTMSESLLNPGRARLCNE